jgi:hypothetical protein
MVGSLHALLCVYALDKAEFSEQKQKKKTRRLESSCIAFLVLLLLLLTVEIPLKE